MLIEHVLRDLDIPRPSDYAGNPIRGSRLGRCARQSGYMLWPDAYPADPLPARARLVFKFGDLVHDFVRTELHRVLPGKFGFDEGRFHFTVPLAVRETKAAQAMLKDRVLSGRLGTASAGPSDRLVLDTATPALHIPLHVDGIAEMDDRALAAVEIKSMATGSFLRAVKGKLDYGYRVQMAAAVEATGLDAAIYFAVRKETSHILEIVYTKQVSEVSVVFTKTSHTSKALGLTVEDGADWEAAEVRHPFEPHLLDQARARVRRILRSTVTNLPEREYGPSFACATCDGHGVQHLAKTTKEPLKRGPKPCVDCREGTLERAELPFQCRYCPFVATCWPIAKLEIEDERPHLWVSKEDYEASGIMFKGPEDS